MNYQKKYKIRGRITRTPTNSRRPTRRGTGDGGRGTGERDTAKRESQGQAARGAVLRSLDFPFFLCLKVVKRSERAATPLGAPQILRNEVKRNDELRKGKIGTSSKTRS